MRAKSANDLECEWKKRSWYRKPLLESAAPPHPLDDLNLRLRRVLSWLGRAEREYKARDFDAAFIFYWIAFNAAYGQLGPSSNEERRDWDRCDYFDRIVVDSDKAIYDTIWADLPDPIEDMLTNKYVYEPYWQYRNGAKKHKNWKKRFEDAKEEAEQAMKSVQTRFILLELFRRLYTLRNQLLHGGATWESSVNREQVETGAKIMSSLVPHFIDVMIEHPDAGWGAPRYPVVRERGPLSGWTGVG